MHGDINLILHLAQAFLNLEAIVYNRDNAIINTGEVDSIKTPLTMFHVASREMKTRDSEQMLLKNARAIAKMYCDNRRNPPATTQSLRSSIARKIPRKYQLSIRM